MKNCGAASTPKDLKSLHLFIKLTTIPSSILYPQLLRGGALRFSLPALSIDGIMARDRASSATYAY
jgi:hypothetical protein